MSLVALLLAALAWAPIARAGDRFAGVAELRAERREGVDFRVRTLDRRSRTAVLAIHGGNIEHDTSLIASALAGDDWSLYLFEALVPQPVAQDLHVTSTRFDDPAALALARASAVAVSVHGMAGITRSVCIGGSGRVQAAAVAECLRREGFSVEQPCVRFPAVEGSNIVNQAKAGVQLELTSAARRDLAADSLLLRRFIEAVRASVQTAP